MTAPKKGTAKAGTKKSEWLSLTKRTLKDLSARGTGPKGGFEMVDTKLADRGPQRRG
jgi:hypothetical protein